MRRDDLRQLYDFDFVSTRLPSFGVDDFTSPLLHFGTSSVRMSILYALQ